MPYVLSCLKGDDYLLFGPAGSRLAEMSSAALDGVGRLLANSTTRADAERVLSALGPSAFPAVPRLIDALTFEDAEVRRAAARTLRALGSGGTAALPHLVRAIDDSDPTVRDAAIGALGAMGPAAAPALVDHLSRRDADADPETRLSLLSALGRTRSVERAMPLIARASEDPDRHIRAAAVAALAMVGPDDARVLPLLLRAAKDPATEVRAAAANALATADIAAESAVPTFVELAQDQDVFVRQSAVAALRAHGPRAAAAVGILTNLVDTEDSPVTRALAAGALREIGPSALPALDALLRRVKDADRSVREQAVSAIGALGPAAASAVDALREAAMADPNLDAFVRCARLRIQQHTEWHPSMVWQSALPQFEWIQPTAHGILPRERLFSLGATLGSVADTLLGALSNQGYFERSFVAVGEDGFAIVTRAERIDENGARLPPPHRWETGPIYPGIFNLREILRWLQHRDARILRVSVLLVATDFKSSISGRVPLSRVADWITTQGLRLPSRLEGLPFETTGRRSYECALFVYVFRKTEDGPPELVPPGGDRLEYGDHFDKTGFKGEFSRPGG